MKLLHVLPTLDPTGGGPMEGVLQSSLACIRMGHRVDVATFDAPDAAFLADYPLRVHALGPPRSGYGYTAAYVPWLKAHAKDYDAVVVNGLWQYHALGAWRVLHDADVPYYVFPHGMLDPWFRKAYPLKHLKKWLYWPWADYRVLRDARAVLFTCEEEKLLARQSFGLYRAREVVVSFGTSPPPVDANRLRETFFVSHPAMRGKRLFLFLSRIHEKKGCDLLIEAFARVAGLDERLQLVMAGPDHTGLVPRLQARATELGIAERISWVGMLSDDVKWGAFHAAETFVLPSHQENFGIAVAEALGCGLPVLISDKVNIWREISDGRAGLVDRDTVDGCERTLRTWLAMSPDERDGMKARGVALFHERFTVDAMAGSLIDVIERTRFAAPVGDGRHASLAGLR